MFSAKKMPEIIELFEEGICAIEGCNNKPVAQCANCQRLICRAHSIDDNYDSRLARYFCPSCSKPEN